MRFPMVLGAVFACYQFKWDDLRFITSEAALRFAEWRGCQVERLGPDLISWNGTMYHFGIACTFADVFCGAIPLLLIWRSGVIYNLVNVVAFGAVLSVFNVFRICLTDLIFSTGAPWVIADQVIGGAAYFIVWAFLLRWLRLHN
jgi:hypothetical protein